MADFSALKTAIQANIRTNGNEEITGAILQDILLSMVSTMGDGAINALAEALQAEITNRQNAVGGEATARQDADSALSGRINGEATARGEADTALSGRIDGVANSITAINTKLAEGYIYAGIATPSTNPSTPSGKVFYIALQGGTYTNFSGLTVTQGINILKYNGTDWSLEQVWGIDDEPTQGSNNLIKSGGVDICVFNRVVFQTEPTYSYSGVTITITIPSAGATTYSFGYVLKNNYVINLRGENQGSNTYTIPRNNNLVADVRNGLVSVVGSNDCGKNVLLFRNAGNLKFSTGPLADLIRGIRTDGVNGVDVEPTMNSANVVQSGGVAKYIFNHVFFQTIPTWGISSGGNTTITISAVSSERRDFGYVTQSDGEHFNMLLEQAGSQTFVVNRLQYLVCDINTHIIKVVNDNAQGRDIVLYRNGNAGTGLLYAEGLLADFIRRVQSENNFESVYNEMISVKKKVNFVTVGSMNIVSRLGFNVYSPSTPPQSSIPSFMMAYENGYKYMLADLRLTSDNIFVTGHDDDIRDFGARNSDGSQISSAVNISEHTLTELNQYDYGIYKGAQYAGLKLLTIADFLKFCKFRNIKAVLELKISLNSSQIDNLKALILSIMRDLNDTILCFDGTAAYWESVIAAFPKMEMWGHIVNSQFNIANVDALANLNNPNGNKLVLYQSPYNRTMTDITTELADVSDYAISRNILLGMSQVESMTELISTDTFRCLSYAAVTHIEDYYDALLDGSL